MTVEAATRSNGKSGIKNADLQVLPDTREQVRTIEGTVVARKCEHCEHHEIGIETSEGEYVPLQPGTKVQIKK